jgi:hypothetical protein
MKKSIFKWIAIAAVAFSGQVFADADDTKWINQCIKDNKGEKGGTPEIVKSYCTCMNNKMSDSETRTISQWEKANPKAMAACEKEAGWK